MKQRKHQSENLHKTLLLWKKNIEKFKNIQQSRNWDDIKNVEDPSKAYKYFLSIFIDIYDQPFPKTEVKVKFKSDQNPWITKGIAKSSTKKQRLYEKFLKNRTPDKWRDT